MFVGAEKRSCVNIGSVRWFINGRGTLTSGQRFYMSGHDMSGHEWT